jgi:hypothetical protein
VTATRTRIFTSLGFQGLTSAIFTTGFDTGASLSSFYTYIIPLKPA